MARLKKIAWAYGWSFVFWLGFAPMLAIERHLRFIQQGEQEKFSYILLMDVAWCLTFAILTPPIFYLGRRFPITQENASRELIRPVATLRLNPHS